MRLTILILLSGVLYGCSDGRRTELKRIADAVEKNPIDNKSPTVSRETIMEIAKLSWKMGRNSQLDFKTDSALIRTLINTLQ